MHVYYLLSRHCSSETKQIIIITKLLNSKKKKTNDLQSSNLYNNGTSQYRSPLRWGKSDGNDDAIILATLISYCHRYNLSLFLSGLNFKVAVTDGTI